MAVRAALRPVSSWSICGAVHDQTRKVDTYMMNKRARRNRIGLAFAGISAAMLASWAPNAQATGNRPQASGTKTVRLTATGTPSRAMGYALKACAPVPRSLRQLCHSLALRPSLGDVPAGLPIVCECLTEARAESRRHGAAHGRDYLTGCLRENVLRP